MANNEQHKDGFFKRFMDRLTGKVPTGLRAQIQAQAAAKAQAQASAPAVVSAPTAEFPFEVIRVPGERVLEEVKSLAAQGRGYPVLVGPPDELDSLITAYRTNDRFNVDDLLREADQVDPLQWLRERAESDPEHYEEVHGPWPENEPPYDQIITHCDILRGGKPYPEVCIVLVPAQHAWQVPCVLRNGGWNDCPRPQDHAAMMRYWEQQYGARIVALGHDTIEMSVERPPATREAAVALAAQQYIYCADVVRKGSESMESLAASLLNGRMWFFWWD